MSDRNGFGSGFWLGTLVGGVIGGIVGASIAQRATQRDEDGDNGLLSGEVGRTRPLKSAGRSRAGDRMELARRSLDDKISDLNNAIDSVRSSIAPIVTESVDAVNDGQQNYRRSSAKTETSQPSPDNV
jgi:hypothetical protein